MRITGGGAIEVDCAIIALECFCNCFLICRPCICQPWRPPNAQCLSSSLKSSNVKHLQVQDGLHPGLQTLGENPGPHLPHAGKRTCTKVNHVCAFPITLITGVHRRHACALLYFLFVCFLFLFVGDFQHFFSSKFAWTNLDNDVDCDRCHGWR